MATSYERAAKSTPASFDMSRGSTNTIEGMEDSISSERSLLAILSLLLSEASMVFKYLEHTSGKSERSIAVLITRLTVLM